MKKKSKPQREFPLLLVTLISMVIITIVIAADTVLKINHDSRSRAFTESSTGLRIEGEEMSLNGNVQLDLSGGKITFGQ